MKILDLWKQQIVSPQTLSSPPQPPNKSDTFTNIVWNVQFTPDGSKLLVVVGDFILIYDASNGEVMHSIRGYHKSDIYCIAINRNGSRLATGRYPPHP